MRKQLLTIMTLMAVAGCGSGGGSGSATSVPSIPVAPTATPAVGTNSNLVYPVFTLSFPMLTSSSGQRTPLYVPVALQSVNIVLSSVNGAAPPAGLKTSAVTNVTAAGCAKGCSVNAPASPPGTDTFIFTTYSGAGGNGSALATATQTFTIVAGSSNPGGNITLYGIPAKLTIANVPAATAGTKVSQALGISAQDASGQTITGPYATPISLTDSDTSGATSLSVNGGAPGSSVTIASASDSVTFAYSGGAVSNVQLAASANGATGATAAFQPIANPMIYTGPLVGSVPEVDLFSTSGAGSSGTVAFSETGYSGAPFGGVFTASASGCGSIATVSPATGTTFTIAAVPSPNAGTCSMTFTDASGQSKSVTVTYTTFSIGGFQ